MKLLLKKIESLEAEENYMKRAMDLAMRGKGKVSPNPLVGSVIVHEGKIIGEGWHQEYGQAHAEVNAVNSVEDPSLLKESTVYVNLEPCAHHGKTPPCAEMLAEKQVAEVVISNTDPNPLVAGKGIEILKNAGIKVRSGLMENEGEKLNRRFFKAISSSRPYVILKWAQTRDGFIARENYDSKWISDEHSRKLVHKWRAEEDAIMVGTNTALHDNPRLNVRDWEGNDPTRVVIDRNNRLSSELALFDGSISTLCYGSANENSGNNLEKIAIEGEQTLEFILEDLHQRKLHSLIVEGGSALLHSFIENDLWDEARVFQSPKEFEKGIAAPVLSIKPNSRETLVEDELLTYFRKNPAL